MRRRLLVASIVVGTLFTAAQGLGFFEDLFEPRGDQPKKQQQGKSSQSSEKGLIEGIGAIFGVKKKDIELFKKGVKTVQALQPIGEEEEITIGQAVAVEAFSRFGGSYRNESLVRYVNLVGKTVAEVSDRPELNYHFAILSSGEQNAFAAPGGYIFVTIGLLRTLKNEAELAGVLAHEVAHVTERHMLETIRRSAVLANVSEFTLTAMDKDPEMFASVIDQVTETLFEQGLDQDLEYEADVVGVEYAYRAGYNPHGLKDYLRILKSQEGRAVSRFFSTHPSTSVRITKLGETLPRYRDAASLPYLASRFKKQMKTG